MSTYDYGLDVLGARPVLGGGSARGFDNHNYYAFADVVYYDGKYWKAVRDVMPPTFPALQSGDVPGDSDAWREISQSAAGDTMGFGHGHGGGHGGGWGGGRGRGWGWGGAGRSYYGDPFDDGPEYLVVDQAEVEAPSFPASADPNAYKYEASKTGLENLINYVEWDKKQKKGAEILGAMFDIQSKQREMNGLKQVTVGIAQALLGGGQRAIDRARYIAEKYNLPAAGDTGGAWGKSRDDVYWKLQWHADELAKHRGSSIDLYAPGSDLKEWVMLAFIACNAAEEGKSTVEAMTVGQMWADMFYVIGKELAKLPKAMRKLVEDVTGVPTWAWIAGGTMLLGLLTYGSYKILRGPVGGAIVHRYIGGR